MQLCHKESLELIKDKSHFGCMKVPFFAEIVCQHNVQPDPYKLHILANMLPLTINNSVFSRCHALFRKILSNQRRGV